MAHTHLANMKQKQKDQILIVIGGGKTTAIYSDALVEAFAGEGELKTRRASHVEPCADGWQADMAPMGGPILGPYALRQTALKAEVAWLEKHLTGAGKTIPPSSGAADEGLLPAAANREQGSASADPGSALACAIGREPQ